MRKSCTYILFSLASFALISAACSWGPKSGQYKIALVPDAAGQHGIFVTNSDRSGGKLLNPEPTAQLLPSSWSPDGRKIAYFATRREDARIVSRYRMPVHSPLYVMDSNGSNQRRLLDFPVSSFSWSPDSRQLLYVSAYEDPSHDDPDVLQGRRTPMSAVYLLDIQTGAQRRVTGFGQICSGSWSPNGTQLALTFGDPKSSKIYVASVDGKHTREVSDSTALNTKPAWSPDGKRIAYITAVFDDTGMRQDVVVVQSDGTNKRQIQGTNSYEVSWSVDGKSLLLQSMNGITLVSAEGNTLLDYKNRAVQPRDALFAPDGKELVFRSNHEGPWHLYAMDLNGAHVRRISDLSSSMFCLSPIAR